MKKEKEDIKKEECFLEEQEGGQLAFIDTDDDNYFPVSADYGKIPNRFIERYGNVSYLANLGMMLAIQKVERRSRELYRGTKEGLFYEEIYKKTGADFSDGLVACIPINQFLKLYDLSSAGRTYKALDELYNGTMLRNQWQILYEDKDVIASVAVLTATAYDKVNKNLLMKFNSDLDNVILNIQKDYAQISLPVLGKLREDFVTNIYQLFKKRFDAEQAKNKKYGYFVQNEIKIDFALDHLYFIIGLYPIDLSSNDEDMKKVVELLRVKDYDMAAKVMREKGLIEKYSENDSRKLALDDFSYFKRHYLDKAFKRINGFPAIKKLEKTASEEFPEALKEYESNCRTHHPTDIHFRYEILRGGRGGRAIGCRFFISRAEWGKAEEIIPDKAEEPENYNIAQMRAIIAVEELLAGEAVSEKDIAAIARKADWNVDKVRKAYTVAKEKPRSAFVGFLLKAIEGDWEPSVQSKAGVSSAEEYTYEYLKESLNIEDALMMHPEYEQTLMAFLDVIYDTMNSDAPRIKVGNGTLPADAVKRRLLELNELDLCDAVEMFLNNSRESGIVRDSYIVTILYNIRKQSELRVNQQLQRNMGKYKAD